MKSPTVSLVIPAYNEENYIKECLEHAVRNSGGRFFEIIVIDNASTDRTGEIARSVPGVRVVREEKKGLTQARQRGFIEAKGDVLAYTDADTHMPPGWYDRVIQEFSANDRLTCLSGPYFYYDIPRWQQFLVHVYWTLLAVPAYRIVGYMAVGGNFCLRRDVLEKMKGFDTSIAFYGEDTDIARRAHAFGKVKFSSSFVMATSGRRFKGQGLFKTSMLYMINFFSEVVFHSPTSTEYRDIR